MQILYFKYPVVCADEDFFSWAVNIMADVEVYDQESLGDSSVTADSLMSEFNHLAIYWVCLVTS